MELAQPEPISLCRDCWSKYLPSARPSAVDILLLSKEAQETKAETVAKVEDRQSLRGSLVLTPWGLSFQGWMGSGSGVILEVQRAS